MPPNKAEGPEPLADESNGTEPSPEEPNGITHRQRVALGGNYKRGEFDEIQERAEDTQGHHIGAASHLGRYPETDEVMDAHELIAYSAIARAKTMAEEHGVPQIVEELRVAEHHLAQSEIFETLNEGNVANGRSRVDMATDTNLEVIGMADRGRRANADRERVAR